MKHICAPAPCQTWSYQGSRAIVIRLMGSCIIFNSDVPEDGFDVAILAGYLNSGCDQIETEQLTKYWKLELGPNIAALS